MAKRIGIASIVGLIGLVMLPAARVAIEDVAGEVATGMADAKYGSFIELVADHAYIGVILLWIAALVVILFWPREEEHREITR